MIEHTILYRADLFIKRNVGTDLQRHQIVQEILEKQKVFPSGIANSNPGCYRVGAPCTDISWLLDEINELLDSAVNFYSKHDSVFKKNTASNYLDLNYWANINEPGSRNTMHTHKSEHFSVVYYVQAEGTGELRFTNPANVLGDCNVNAPFMRDFYYPPNTGDLILWPSWVPHEVETNFSDKQRINLTFDIKIKL